MKETDSQEAAWRTEVYGIDYKNSLMHIGLKQSFFNNIKSKILHISMYSDYAQHSYDLIAELAASRHRNIGTFFPGFNLSMSDRANTRDYAQASSGGNDSSEAGASWTADQSLEGESTALANHVNVVPAILPAIYMRRACPCSPWCTLAVLLTSTPRCRRLLVIRSNQWMLVGRREMARWHPRSDRQ